MDYPTILAMGKTAISQAGKIALDIQAKGVTLFEKTRDYGTVSEADTAVEQFLKTWVRTTFPDESIVAEESGGEALRIG
ncbi:MAG TPA: inositol monophosphatase family protein, partial [Candidatus Saccharimonadales bacterium]|nr:inositol monophosphatase family protein [Candidatus Saccharimonadales bacterium]